MTLLILAILFAAVCVYLMQANKKKEEPQEQQPIHFDMLDENGDPIRDQPQAGKPAVKELQYFCIKDKGYHVTVWPKDYNHFDMVRFNIAGIEYRDNIDEYLGESVGVLEAEPTNPYDPNAIKILTHDGHHVGYVPKDMTDEVRKVANLPCSCFFYIGKRNGIYFSDCYIPFKN